MNKKQLKKQLDLANKEIVDLKKNIRKACSCNNKKSELTKKEKIEITTTENNKKKGRKPKNAK